MSLKSALSKLGSKIKSTVQKVTSNIQKTASKVIETVKDKSSAIVQTVASVSTGNVAGAITGVASILTPTNKNNSVSVTKITETKTNTSSTAKKSDWKVNYNAYTKVLNY